MLLYHGSKSGIIGEITPYYKLNRETCDFGKGFYLGDMPEQPKGLIVNRKNGRYYEIEYNMEGLKIKKFEDDYDDQMDWALFIAYNRMPQLFEKYPSLKARYDVYSNWYDIFIGLIADDSMVNTLNKFFTGSSTDKVLIDCLKHVKLGKQYVLKTDRACDKERIQILVDRQLTSNEKKMAYAESAQRNNQMDSIIKMYETKYRRDMSAKYIDEIMEEWNTPWNLPIET